MRRKADGPAFEREFKGFIETKYYTKRLHTAFTSNPSDFIVIGRRFNYVEVKETAQKSFSLASLQQLSEIKEYVKDRDFYKNTIIKDSKYWLVVHFLEPNVIKVIEAKQILDMISKKVALKPSTECLSYSKLMEFIEGGDLF